MSRENLAIAAHKKSIACAQSGNKEEWLALFTDDAIVRDPVGKSPHDPQGQGFQGKERRAQFWDMMIATGNLVIVPHKRIPVGEHICSVVMTATNYIGGLKTFIEMVACYEVNDAGSIASLNVYWDVESIGEQLAAQGVKL
jgi:steroid delta-isomerase